MSNTVKWDWEVRRDGKQLHGEEAEQALRNIFPYEFEENGVLIRSMWPKDSPDRLRIDMRQPLP